MSLLGIDVGTTGCKVAAFTHQGRMIASAYREYPILHPQPGYAELNAGEAWLLICEAIHEVVEKTKQDPVTAISVSSLGEAVVPVKNDRSIVGPSILNFDIRGEEYLPYLKEKLPREAFYDLNGNTIGNNYGLTKLMWIKQHQPEIYQATDKFLLWSSFVGFMLGAEAKVDYCLANRTLLFDVDNGCWSNQLLIVSGIDKDKLPEPVPTATIIGKTSSSIASSLGLAKGIPILAGAHDQCANAVGCGVIDEGHSMYGMGTFLCAVPVFSKRPATAQMIEKGFNTEHHAAPDRFVSFLYNQGGSLLKWYRDTFAIHEAQMAKTTGEDIYAKLIAEMPSTPSGLLVLPHFTVTGPPEYITDSCGLIMGLRTETSRGDILKGILEGVTFYMRELLESFEQTGVNVDSYTAAGGGAKSDAWLQLSADIIGKPFHRPAVTEAGALGAALIAGVGTGVYGSFEEATNATVRIVDTFEPITTRHRDYSEPFELYKQLWPNHQSQLRRLSKPSS